MNAPQATARLLALADQLGKAGMSLGFVPINGKTVLDEHDLRDLAGIIALTHTELTALRESAQTADLPQPAPDCPPDRIAAHSRPAPDGPSKSIVRSLAIPFRPDSAP